MVRFWTPEVGGGQGELVQEASLNCIFGSEQRPSLRGRTADPVCGGFMEVKVFHCTGRILDSQPLTGFLMFICIKIQHRVKKAGGEPVELVNLASFNKSCTVRVPFKALLTVALSADGFIYENYLFLTRHTAKK